MPSTFCLEETHTHNPYLFDRQNLFIKYIKYVLWKDLLFNKYNKLISNIVKKIYLI